MWREGAHVAMRNSCRCILGCTAPRAQPARTLGSLWGDVSHGADVLWVHPFFTLCLGSSRWWGWVPPPWGGSGCRQQYGAGRRLSACLQAGAVVSCRCLGGRVLGSWQGCRGLLGPTWSRDGGNRPPALALGPLLGRDGVAAAEGMLAGFWEGCCGVLTEVWEHGLYTSTRQTPWAGVLVGGGSCQTGPPSPFTPLPPRQVTDGGRTLDLGVISPAAGTSPCLALTPPWLWGSR